MASEQHLSSGPLDDHFRPFKGAVYLKAYHNERERRVVCQERESYSEESEVVNQMTEPLEGKTTKVVFLPRPDDGSPDEFRISMSEISYRKIAKQYDFPESIFKMLYGAHAVVYKVSEEMVENIVFRHNGPFETMVMSYNPALRSTMALALGPIRDEAAAFIDAFLRRKSPPHWSFLLCTVLELTAKLCSKRLSRDDRDMWKIGDSLKTHKLFADSKIDGNFDIKSLDFLDATRSLNDLLVESSCHRADCDSAQGLLREVEGLVRSDAAAMINKEEARLVEVAAKENLQLLRSWYDGLRPESDACTRCLGAMMQTVYSLISQRDSAINLEIAQSASQVAELSRQDNLAMREVAILAAKDSATMRVIATVTLFFLPPTFLATMFSASYFDFTPKPGDHVSVWLWLYFVLSVVLLAVVMGFWKFSTRQKLKNIPEKP